MLIDGNCFHVIQIKSLLKQLTGLLSYILYLIYIDQYNHYLIQNLFCIQNEFAMNVMCAQDLIARQWETSRQIPISFYSLQFLFDLILRGDCKFAYLIQQFTFVKCFIRKLHIYIASFIFLLALFTAAQTFFIYLHNTFHYCNFR